MELTTVYWDEIEQCQKDRPCTPEEIAEIQARQNALPPVPQSVDMWRARRALLVAGKLALVQPAIDAMPEPQKSEANIMWNSSTIVVRDDPFTLALGASLGLDAAAIDQLFIAAAQL